MIEKSSSSDASKVRHCHMAGVGGAGMAPVAMLLSARGCAVTGEDDGLTPETRSWLERFGVRITARGALPVGTEMLVYSSAIKADHPARLEAVARGLTQLQRGAMLAELARGRRLIAVAGSHGKTTTTAMIATIFSASHFSGGWAVGGLFEGDAMAPARDGSDWLVAEIDESDGTIAGFSPEITVVTNMDWDHPDHYRRPADMEAAFAALIARTKSLVLLNAACPVSARLARGVADVAVKTFGPGGDYRFAPSGGADGRQLLDLGGAFPRLQARLKAGGDFNAVNASAALAVAQEIGIDVHADLLAEFRGVRRRQSVLLDEGGIVIVEDYAHHPSEIAALLAGMRRVPHRRMVVAFQPHRYSRTAQFKEAFARSLSAADELFLLDVYSAGESPVSGGTTADIYAALAQSGEPTPATYLPGDTAGFLDAITAQTREGDLVLFVGAGDIDRLARDYVQRVRGQAAGELRFRAFADAARRLLAPGGHFSEHEPLGAKTTLRVGGPARCYAEPAGEEDLAALVREAAKFGIPVLMLGRGSNLLVPDAGVRALVIRLQGAGWQQFTPLADGTVWAGAGMRLKELCGLAAAQGLAGFEFLEGIPGTLGGALRMNAGAMGGGMFDVVESVRALLPDGSVRTLKRGEFHVAYRECRELEGAIALGAALQPVSHEDTATVRERIAAFQARRHETQPRESSAGCMFKNPPGTSAGLEIDRAGLKGLRIGDAEVSPVHANFIINRGHATSADVVALMREVRSRVRVARGVDLEPEVQLFGADWREVL
ncbi:MAG TPA: UDP-N-acetylmuramate dehydrogenase [Opitutaceae bacterium]|nr:UDP-N-acetylmuramate dehydrogenase [Opitutaceae bacterium]